MAAGGNESGVRSTSPWQTGNVHFTPHTASRRIQLADVTGAHHDITIGAEMRKVVAKTGAEIIQHSNASAPL